MKKEYDKNKVLEFVPARYKNMVIDAIKFASMLLAGQKRLNGDDFVVHTLEVALLVAQIGLDVDSILTAILHHAFRYSDQSYSPEWIKSEISKRYGADILSNILVLDALSNITQKQTESQALTKYILKGTEDLRIIMIRLCDKLHNARTICALPEAMRISFADKLVKIYAPLAEYLNLTDYKKEYEDIALEVLHPEEYREIGEYINSTKLNNEIVLQNACELLQSYSRDIDNKPIVFGRIKSRYSIYRKLKKYSEEGRPAKLTNLHDILAFTIIAKDMEQCYEIASTIEHETAAEAEKFEDYIMNPKPNGFRELQLIVPLSINGEKYNVEIQIMTYEMYEHNTYGEASHFAYKQAGIRFAKPNREFMWVKDIRDKIQLAVQNDKDRDSRSRPIISRIFAEQIYVFTPKEEIIELPIGATPIDFAYRIHSQIAQRAVCAEINGVRRDLYTELKNGDTVRIIVTPNKSVKSTIKEDWLKHAKTKIAISQIEKLLKKW